MEDNREDQHEVEGIAHSDNITKQRAVWDTKVSVEIGKHIMKDGIAKEEETKEACGNIDGRAKKHRCSYNGLYLRRVLKFIVYGMYCITIKISLS